MSPSVLAFWGGKNVWSSLWTTLIGNEGLLARSSSVSANPGVLWQLLPAQYLDPTVQALPVGSLEPEWIVSMFRVFYRLHGHWHAKFVISLAGSHRHSCEGLGTSRETSQCSPFHPHGQALGVPEEATLPSVGLTKESLELQESQQGLTCHLWVTVIPTWVLPASLVKPLSLVYLAVQLSGLSQLFSPFKVKY